MILDKLDKITLEPRGVYPPSPPHDPGHLSALVHPHHAEQPPLPRTQALDPQLERAAGLAPVVGQGLGECRTRGKGRGQSTASLCTRVFGNFCGTGQESGWTRVSVVVGCLGLQRPGGISSAQTAGGSIHHGLVALSVKIKI
jgi:hypothetical protein